MACCNMPERLQIDLTGLVACSACTAGGTNQWAGTLKDYDGNRCVYYVDSLLEDIFDVNGGLNRWLTHIRRDQHFDCTWLLFIACDHCTFKDWLWIGSGPHFQPTGEYRMLRGCANANVNTTIETLNVTEATT